MFNSFSFIIDTDDGSQCTLCARISLQTREKALNKAQLLIHSPMHFN